MLVFLFFIWYNNIPVETKYVFLFFKKHILVVKHLIKITLWIVIEFL